MTKHQTHTETPSSTSSAPPSDSAALERVSAAAKAIDLDDVNIQRVAPLAEAVLAIVALIEAGQDRRR